jgi:rhodanese-related sulfurtransferase
MNKELLFYFLNENWILFAGLFLATIMTYISFISSRFSALSPEQAIRYINDGAWVIDTREIEDFRREHIGGAKNHPASNLNKTLAEEIKKQKTPADILLYCLNGARSIPTIKKLKPLSLEAKVHYIQGGFNAWKAASYPVSKEVKKSKKKHPIKENKK